jgi:signal transduction histidine kinase
VTLTVALRRAAANVPSGSDELRADVNRIAEDLITAVEELRELSQGIHPAELSEGGLSPALKALGRRSALRVELDVPFDDRLPDQVEVAAYTVSEALTNASKHSDAKRVWVSLDLVGDVLRLSIRDDGIGGADASLGSGLTGLRDRIEAMGGRLHMESPRERGTSIEVEIPLVNRRIKLASARRGRRQRWSVGSVWGAEANSTGVIRFGLRQARWGSASPLGTCHAGRVRLGAPGS